MTREELCAEILEAIDMFDFSGKLQDYTPYGSGHINDTFLLTFLDNGEENKYVLQRINHFVFKNPIQLMENITGVTEFLKQKIQESGGNPKRDVLNLVPAKDGKNYYQDSIGSWWRAALLIENTISLDSIQRPEQFFQSGLAFGGFQKLLSDYPVETLHETIKDFHYTPKRFDNFKEALKSDSAGKAAACKAEIDFVLEHEYIAHLLVDLHREGKIPLRVTHNDTKLNNVMLDKDTEKAVCVLDLDTVMPGLSAYDFGDSIRFGANTADEDEQDLSKMKLDLELYKVFADGYLEGFGDQLTQDELLSLPLGSILITYECGMRFLTDHLSGDVYYRISRENHNLDRARTQFKLVAEMLKYKSEVDEIFSPYLK